MNKVTSLTKIHFLVKQLRYAEESYSEKDFEVAIAHLNIVKDNIKPLINSIEMEKDETNMSDMQKQS